jgi:hypothetical protein
MGLFLMVLFFALLADMVRRRDVTLAMFVGLAIEDITERLMAT